MVKGGRQKRGANALDNTSKQINESLKELPTSGKRKKISDENSKGEKQTPLNSPVNQVRKDGRITGKTETKGKNNNASVSENKNKTMTGDGNFLKAMDKKYGGRRSDPIERLQGTKSPKSKRFSLMDDALRNPG